MFASAFKHSNKELLPPGAPPMWTCSFQHGENFVGSVEKLSREEVRRRMGLAPEPLHTWESPDWSILDDRRGDLPKFPADCLGKAFMTVRRAAKGAGVTDAHVAVPMLGIASTLIGVARRIQASKSWLEPCTMWC